MRLQGILITIFLAWAILPAAAQTGMITGIVTSGNNTAVSDALVTLTDLDGSIVDVANNPQYTTNLSSSITGVYTFMDLAPGTYNVTAAKGGYSFYATVEVKPGTTTANIVIPELIETQATVEPRPSKTYYTYVPVKIASARPQSTQTRSPGLEWPAALASLGAVLYLFKRKGE